MKALLQHALDALDKLTDKIDGTGFSECDEFSNALDVISALRAAIAQPESEPALFMRHDQIQKAKQSALLCACSPSAIFADHVPLYEGPVHPTGCISNCDTCHHSWGSPANPGYCYMFFTEPQGICEKHTSSKKSYVQLTDDQVLSAIQSCGVELRGRIALTYESGPYDIDRPTVVAMQFSRAIEKAVRGEK